MTAAAPIRVGISSCLLGNQVRYDGAHKRDRYVTDVLGDYFEFMPVCPEVAIGLGVPRAPIHLVGHAARPRAVGADDATRDVTAALAAYGRRQGRVLTDLRGYIFKSRSPSCGLARVPVRRGTGTRASHGRGIYAAAFCRMRPLLPVEEEQRLADPAARDNFIERVFAYDRWQALGERGITAARLKQFHRMHALALMTHGARHCAALDRLIARAHRGNVRLIASRYCARFFETLQRRATRGAHARVLQHAFDCLKQRMSAADRAQLLERIDGYRRGNVPLSVPVRLLGEHCRRGDPDMACQVYLHPDAREFALRYRA